ncbi:hypothetical protein EV421DRAFT_795702 [Armillaria borealis]|uniref:Uncharacterized protein n=1 Tax=Armillaria borealis TaxID=47425 RepID=A0AA39JDE9_9AGAR|nr:hypothetical protein EV421DRAFT_795702 [Armillaria borealis]
MLIALMRLMLISGLATSVCLNATLITVWQLLRAIRSRFHDRRNFSCRQIHSYSLRSISSSPDCIPTLCWRCLMHEKSSEKRFRAPRSWTSECECGRETEMLIVISMRIESESA